MTALDDALNSSSVVLGPHKLQARWIETSHEDIETNPDAVGNLTDQFNGNMTVTHSLDDGLPDSVTMTTGNDASGFLEEAGLNGREGLTLASSGQRPYDASGSASGSATYFVAGNIPANAAKGDYLLCAVLVNNASASLAQTHIDPKDNWDILGAATAGSGLQLLLYGTRSTYTGRKPLALQSDRPISYISTTTAFWAANPLGYPLTYRATYADAAAETVSGTSHTKRGPLRDKGYQVGIWGSASGVGPWTGTVSGATEWNETVSLGLDLMLSTSGLRDAGSMTLTANTTSATATAILGMVSLEPYARPRMDAKQYFSPFNTDSPVYSFERDTAEVLANIRVLTAEGPVDTQIFKGQMLGLQVSGRDAVVSATSKTRMWMNRTVNLPIVSSNRENLSVDWLATWLMARGSSFVGVAPNKYTRFFSTFYGSIHNTWGTELDYNAAFEWRADRTPTGRYGISRLRTVVGPDGMPAMFGEQTAVRTQEILVRPDKNLHNFSTNEFPHLYDDGGTGPLMIDFLSQQNSKGRVSFWVRADPIFDDPPYFASVPASDPSNNRIEFYVESRGKDGSYKSFVRLWLQATATGAPASQMGCSTNGFGAVSASTFAIPQDGNWHFFGFWWDYAAGRYSMKLDGLTSSNYSSYYANNNWNYTADMPATDDELRRAGGYVDLKFRAHSPVQNLVVDTGIDWSPTLWDDVYPTPAAPGRNATMRPTYQPMVALAQPDAVNVWDTLADLARSSLSAYRADESDAMNFLPISYFGETAQMTPSAVVQDVSVNASDLDVEVDNSKIRNVVTVQASDFRLDSRYSNVLTYSSVVEVPRGTSVATFTLDALAVEIHGAAFKWTDDYQLIPLSAAQIATPSTIPGNRHYFTPNLSVDGTGTVLTAQQIQARFIAVDAGSVTIQFTNKSNKTAYLVNNGDQVPYLRILGYGVRGGDAYTTVRDTHSVAIRRERGLETTLSWVQDRATARDLASLLVGQLAIPRAEMDLTVLGDPRRKPGQLITIADADGTRASGTWRILSVRHNLAGAQYTQDLKVIQQFPVATWGGPNGWGIGVWGAE